MKYNINFKLVVMILYHFVVLVANTVIKLEYFFLQTLELKISQLPHGREQFNTQLELLSKLQMAYQISRLST